MMWYDNRYTEGVNMWRLKKVKRKIKSGNKRDRHEQKNKK